MVNHFIRFREIILKTNSARIQKSLIKGTNDIQYITPSGGACLYICKSTHKTVQILHETTLPQKSSAIKGYIALECPRKGAVTLK